LLGWWGLSRSNAQANATVLALSDRADFTRARDLDDPA
jgi:hypothetical protein